MMIPVKKNTYLYLAHFQDKKKQPIPPEGQVFLPGLANLSSLLVPVDEVQKVKIHFICRDRIEFKLLHQPSVPQGHFVLVGQCHPGSPVNITAITTRSQLCSDIQ